MCRDFFLYVRRTVRHKELYSTVQYYNEIHFLIENQSVRRSIFDIVTQKNLINFWN